MRRWVLALCLTMTALTVTEPSIAMATARVDKSGLKSSQTFAFDLYRRAYAQTEGGNVALSPLSVQLALSLTANGAKAQTRSGMLRALSNSSIDRLNKTNQQLITLFEGTSQGADVRMGNAVFLQDALELQPSFQEISGKYYDATLSALDFHEPEKAAGSINAWVKERTVGLIPELVDAGAVEDAMMCLVNTVYFNGVWSVQFSPSATQDAPFTTLSGKEKSVPTMHGSARALDYYKGRNYEAVRLPYGDGRLSMSVFLPTRGQEKTFIRDFGVDTWLDWHGRAKSTNVQVSMPKFRQETRVSLKPILSKMGMEQAFQPGKADFSGLASIPDGKAFISDVLHSTVVRVDEKGTEAAAATGVIVGVTSMPVDLVAFSVDRPFTYVIEDSETGAILFIGAVGDPEAE